MPTSTRRSIAIVPAHRPERIIEALPWDADALCLDLADQILPVQRAQARQQVRNAVAAVAQRGVEPLVRVNAEDLQADLDAAVGPGLSAIVAPGLRGPEDVRQVDDRLTYLEVARDMAPGTVRLVAYLDHGQGLWHAREIVAASPRVDALVLGMGDLAFDMLKVPEEVPFFTGPTPRFPVPECVWGRLALVAAEARVPLLGLLGTTIAPGHAEEEQLLKAARLAWQAGFKGAFTFHREGVEACNEGFSVPPEALERAREALKSADLAPTRRRQAEALLAQDAALRAVRKASLGRQI